MQILTVSGSLREASSNSALLQALCIIAGPEDACVAYTELAHLPAFNPDREDEPLAPVAQWRDHLKMADVVVFSTPEYAHGIPGALKNALDWVVGSGELSAKPVCLLHGSARGSYARDALREVLLTMNARVLDAAETTVPLLPGTNAQQIANSDAEAQLLQTLLTHVRQALEPPRSE